jgi:hypothetical protein
VDQATSRRKQNKGPESRSTLSVNGRVRLLRRHYHSQAAGTATPADDLLDAAHDTISVATRQLCCQLNRASRSFEMTAQNLQQAARLSVSGEKLRGVVEADGQAILKASCTGDPQPAWLATECKAPGDSGKSLVYLGSDGFNAPTITDQEKQARRKAVMRKRRKRKGHKPRLPRRKRGTDQTSASSVEARYKEFKVVMFYDHELTRKHVSVTRGDCREAGRIMRRDAGRLGFGAADARVGNVDGGPWIINQIKLQRLQMTAVGLDFYHLGDNVHKTRRIVFGEAAEGTKMAGDLLHTAKHHGYEPLREAMLEVRKGTRGSKRKEVDRLMDYASDRRAMIRYPEFLANGWQIGSGPTESQCRITPDRVKRPGQRWDRDNAEAIMAIEAMYQSEQEAAYWRLALSGKC